ncbi:MAG: hypothetical protein IRY99_17905 [Isosphaeraceae bacterium]|nr:hypothetical protein [Isosphaeraceae bacterium]
MDWNAEVSRLLQELGETPDAVAAALRANKVRGVRNAARDLNPIVRYVQVRLRDESIDMDVIRPGRLSIHFRTATAPTQEVPIPEAILQFLAAFNRGGYPDLELEFS